MNMPVVDAVLLGAGQRGTEAIGAFILKNPGLVRFVAVAEPDEGRRCRFAEQHSIDKDNCFTSYEELLSRDRIAPLCFDTTMDREHLPSALLALEKGYHLFLEKPMAHSPEACVQIARAARDAGRIIQICHPLRHTAFYKNIKSLLDEGAIGDLVSFSMDENVCYWHFAHSFVRGNWGRSDTSGPFMLTKCCHDMDLAAWLGGAPVSSVASFGERSLFREENAPEGASARCTDGCPAEKECPFSAPAFYLTDVTEWPVSTISTDTSLEAHRQALETGPYGRCVFRCDNDVVDHQVVNVEFANGNTLNFSVRAMTSYPYRAIRLCGTKGEIRGHFEKSEIAVTRFEQGYQWFYEPEIISIPYSEDSAHGGGDGGAIRTFLQWYHDNDIEASHRSLDIAIEGHLLSFAAEQARQEKQMIDMEKYRERFS
jgi:predicted dehydrogenase